MRLGTRSFGFLLLLAAFALHGADQNKLVVIDSAPLLRLGPPTFEVTTERLTYMQAVTVAEEKKDAAGKTYARIAELQSKPACWTLASNLGSPKEFAASMQPEDPFELASLPAGDRKFGSIYNARGKFLKVQADRMGVKHADLAAVLMIESGNRGFNSDGRAIIRFENHVFYRRWGVNHKQIFDRHFKFNPNQGWKDHEWRRAETDPWTKCHQSQTSEWEVLEFAKALAESPAYESASYGAPQILGINHKMVGYATPADLVNAMNSGIEPQLAAMIKFIEANKNCMDGLRQQDYTKFARGYNGAGKADEYGKKIHAAALAYGKLIESRKSR